MTPEDILRHDRNAPRYTSYPTAADFPPPPMMVAIATGSPRVHMPFRESPCGFRGRHATVQSGGAAA